MSFTSQRERISDQLSNVNSVQEYHKVYLSSTVVDKIEELSGRYIYHLYNHLYGQETANDLNQFLDDFYGVANEYAKECIEIAITTDHLHGHRVRAWTDHSLHAFDCFLIKLINEKLGEKIPGRGGKLYETDAYTLLIKKGDQLQRIGQAFQSIYQQRSEFTHLQYEDESGKRQVIRWSNKKFKKAKELILMQYSIALAALDNQISD